MSHRNVGFLYFESYKDIKSLTLWNKREKRKIHRLYTLYIYTYIAQCWFGGKAGIAYQKKI